MKKINRTKALLTTICMSLMLMCTTLLTACGTMYTSKAGKMEDLVGTYKITTYKQHDEDGNDVNRIEQLNVKAYLVVGSDGHGYYVYQDNNTELNYDTIAITYNHDNNNTELYKSIKYTNGNGLVTINHQKPGCGYEPTMGFNVNNFTLNYTIPDDRPSQSWLYPSYYTYVVYTKIGNATDLSQVAADMHITFAAMPRYEVKNLDGYLIFHAGMVNTSIAPDVVNEEYGKYKYYIVDFDAITETADIYYELVEGTSGPQVQNDVVLDITVIPASDENYYQSQLVVKFFGKDYHASTAAYSAPPSYLNYEIYTEPDAEGTSWSIYGNWFEKYYDSTIDINTLIANQLDAYNNAQ